MTDSLVSNIYRKFMGKKDIFLGGTEGAFDWRSQIIPSLTKTYYAPNVKKWGEEEFNITDQQWKQSKYQIHVFTRESRGLISVARLMTDVYLRPDTTYFCFIEKDMDEYAHKSFLNIGKMVKCHSSNWVKTLDDLSKILKKI
jgi:hypothetical protein